MTSPSSYIIVHKTGRCLSLKKGNDQLVRKLGYGKYFPAESLSLAMTVASILNREDGANLIVSSVTHHN